MTPPFSAAAARLCGIGRDLVPPARAGGYALSPLRGFGGESPQYAWQVASKAVTALREPQPLLE